MKFLLVLTQIISIRTFLSGSTLCANVFTLCPLVANFIDLWSLMSFANHLDSEEAPQSLGLIWDPNCLPFKLYFQRDFGWKKCWTFMQRVKMLIYDGKGKWSHLWRHQQRCTLLRNKHPRSADHTFAIVFLINTAHWATKFFSLYAHERQILQALIRCRALCTASGQGLQYLFSNKVPFRRWHHILKCNHVP